MSDVFISYSRHNSEFARKLINQLTLAHKDFWVDWEGIPLTALNWWMEIKAGIENADSFIFIMSSDSMASVVCNMELDYALELQKRVIPIVYQEVQSRDAFASIADFQPDEAMQERLVGKDPLVIARNNWQRLSHINWINFNESQEFASAFEKLIEAIETDLEYVKAHTRYLTRAQEWERRNQATDLLLFGEEIKRAEMWLIKGLNYGASPQSKISVVNPLPQALQQQYIQASRDAENQRRRLARSVQISVVSLLVLLMIGALLAYSIVNRTQNQVELAQNELLQIHPTLTQVYQILETAAPALATATDVARQAYIAHTKISEAQLTVTQAAHIAADAEMEQEIAESFSDALIRLNSEQPNTALTIITELMENFPQAETAYIYRGLIYNLLEQPELALLDFNEAIRLNPSSIRAYIHRGYSHRILEDSEAALADFNYAIELEPDNMRAYLHRANTYRTMRALEAALADYNRAIELEPDYAAIYVGRANTYRLLGNLEAALIDYNRAIELEPNYAISYVGRGDNSRLSGDLETALVDYNQAIALDPSYARAYINRGDAYLLLNNVEAALADYNLSISLDPSDARAYLNRGNIYRSLGDFERAFTDYNQAIYLDPSHSRNYLSRANAYRDTGNSEAALTDYQQAINLEPNDALLYRERGNIYYDLL